jgi:hypothetical protein
MNEINLPSFLKYLKILEQERFMLTCDSNPHVKVMMLGYQQMVVERIYKDMNINSLLHTFCINREEHGDDWQ